MMTMTTKKAAGDREGRGAAWVTEGGRGDDGVGPALVLLAAVAAGMNGGDCHHNRMTDDCCDDDASDDGRRERRRRGGARELATGDGGSGSGWR